MLHTRHRALLLITLGVAGIELATHPTNPKRLRHRPAILPTDLVDSVLDHRDAILDLLSNGYAPTDSDAVYLMLERLGIGDDLGMPTHSGSPAWLIAVGESMVSRYCGCTNAGTKVEVTVVDSESTHTKGW
jgi:hypothetical protein